MKKIILKSRVIFCLMFISLLAVPGLRSESDTPSYYSESSYSFTGDTLVMTPHGGVPVSSIAPGQSIFYYDPFSNSWKSGRVRNNTEKSYTGTMVRVTTDKGSFQVSDNHLFPLSGSIRDKDRLVPEEAVPEDINLPGRLKWIFAYSLKSGDLIPAYSGTAQVRNVEVVEGAFFVLYSLSLEEGFLYGVGEGGIAAADRSLLIYDKESYDKKSYEEEIYDEDYYDYDDRVYETSEAIDSFSMDRPPAVDKKEGILSYGERTRSDSIDRIPQESGLRAGYADDNRQFNLFLNFLQEHNQSQHFPLDVSERIILKLTDTQGRSFPNGEVKIYSHGTLLTQGLTHADGSFYFFPSQYQNRASSYHYQIKLGSSSIEGDFDRDQQREINAVLDIQRPETYAKPLDILFILDTTGSMGEEIQRLKNTIELIQMNLSTIRGIPRIRFGLVLYKDRGDRYITQSTALTDNLQLFKADLDQVYAEGGGDGPEDLQAALDSAMNRINWDLEAIRLAYIITDAPAHLDYGEGSVKYTDSIQLANNRGIKIFTVGTGGLDINGEYVLRQISQYTGARYIFLTYGERGESEGGREGSVSHHSGENFNSDKLESIIIQFTREELSHIVPISLTSDESYFSAQAVNWQTREDTLQELFSQACGQLVDYSSIRLEAASPTALVPFSIQNSVDPGQGEWLESQMLLTLNRDESLKEQFALVERKNLQSIVEELKLQLSGVISQDSSVRIGEFLGAKLIISGDIYKQGDLYEVFLKLSRVETGEILSVTKIRIPEELMN